MEKNKNEFEKWFCSKNQQIACLAMRYQWIALFSNNQALFTEDELWNKNQSVALSGLIMTIKHSPELLPQILTMLKRRLQDEKPLPEDIWTDLIGCASFQLKNFDQQKMIFDFVAEQNFNDEVLLKVINSILVCIERMPMWESIAFQCLEQVSFDENVYLLLKDFLKNEKQLNAYNYKMILFSFYRISEEQVPEFIRCLVSVPCSYRYTLAFLLFKTHFAKLNTKLIEAITTCFARDGNVVLQQNLLSKMFSFFIGQEENIDLKVACCFIESVKSFLIRHWENNCIDFEKLWKRYNNCLEFFNICRSAYQSDRNFVLSCESNILNPLFQLKTPLHMLLYLQIVDNADLCVLLLHAFSFGSHEAMDLAKRILAENEHCLKLHASFDEYKPKLSEAMKVYGSDYEFKLFSSAIVNSMVEFGPQLEDISELYDFVQYKSLNVPALYKRYEKEVKELVLERQYEREVLDFLTH